MATYGQSLKIKKKQSNIKWLQIKIPSPERIGHLVNCREQTYNFFLYRKVSQTPAYAAASVTNAESQKNVLVLGYMRSHHSDSLCSALNIQATSDIDMPLNFCNCIFVMDSRGTALFVKQTATRSAAPFFGTEVNATKPCMFDICNYTKLPLIQVSSG